MISRSKNEHPVKSWQKKNALGITNVILKSVSLQYNSDGSNSFWCIPKIPVISFYNSLYAKAKEGMVQNASPTYLS